MLISISEAQVRTLSEWTVAWRRKYFAHKVSAAALESVYICCYCPFFSAAYAVDSRLMKRKFIQKQRKKTENRYFSGFSLLSEIVSHFPHWHCWTLLSFGCSFFCSFPVTPLTERFSALFFSSFSHKPKRRTPPVLSHMEMLWSCTAAKHTHTRQKRTWGMHR